jgi:uncharacterized protein (DUF983 family)
MNPSRANPQSTDRPMRQALLRGLLCRCPNCGRGKLFRAFLKVADECPACGEDFRHQQADDAPAYFVILIVGHIVVPLALTMEVAFAPPSWLQFAIWIPITIGLCVGILQPFKGAIVAWQWAHRMHGFEHAARPDALAPVRVIKSR